MDSLLKKREEELERLDVEDRIAGRKKSIAEQKRLEKAYKHGEGKDWKKILGVVKGVRPDTEVIQDLYGINPDLKELNRPRGRYR